jgi:glycosyltransferase involved in cell wall biosynthesis
MNGIPLRPVQIIPTFFGYGADKLVVQLHQLFLERGVNSRIISLGLGCPPGVPFVKTLGLQEFYHPKAVIRLTRMLKEITEQDSGKAILLHTHLTPCQMWVPIAVKISGLNLLLVTTQHSTFNRRRNIVLGKFFDRQVYKSYSLIVCISEGVKESMANWNPVIKNRLVTIPNGIDLEQFCRIRRIERSTGCPIVISVGRLHAKKNYEASIKACALLKDLNFEYRICGDGPDEQKLKQLIRELGLRNKVKLMGFQPNVAMHLSQSNIFLMSSRWEGFGLAAVEAMACGLPVVVSDVPGVKEVVGISGKGGFLVDPQDPPTIAEKLRILLLNPELRATMGGYNRLEAERYSIKRTADSYLELYNKLFSTDVSRIQKDPGYLDMS